MKGWKVAIAAALVLAALGITLQGFRSRPPPSTEVHFTQARKSPITRSVAGAGKVQAATTVKISSNLSGDLIELKVKEGEKVTKGQVLGKIDKRRFEAASRQFYAAQGAARAEMQGAQIDVDRAAAELARVEGLVGKGLASKSEAEVTRASSDSAAARLASARQKHAQAQAAYEEAQASLEKTTLASPIDGTVIELSREVGERVRGSDFSEDVVMTIAALAAMEVKIEVGEHEVVHLKPGQPADISVDALEGQSFAGTVVEIAQKATIKNQGTEGETTTFPITVALTSRPPGVLPGMSAEVHIAAETRESAVVIPVQAVTVRPEKLLPDAARPAEGAPITAAKRSETLAKVVFVVDADHRARLRRVRTGISSDTDIEVIDGLRDGEKVVEGPYRTLSKELKDGDLLREAEPGEGGPKGRG